MMKFVLKKGITTGLKHVCQDNRIEHVKTKRSSRVTPQHRAGCIVGTKSTIIRE